MNLIFLEIFEKSRFWSKFLKISILVEIFEQKSRFWSKFLKISILVEIFDKSRFWWAKFSKIAILVEIVKKNSFWSKFANNLDFGHILRKSRFSSKCAKISILFTICENLDIGRNFENGDFGRNLR